MQFCNMRPVCRPHIMQCVYEWTPCLYEAAVSMLLGLFISICSGKKANSDMMEHLFSV